MFGKYAAASMDKRKINVGTFDNMLKSQKSMTLASAFKFISEFKIGITEFMRREDVKRIIQVVNLRQETNLNSMSELDLEGFIEFLL
mmetsp:Transcript_29766/g.45375  ORF Transcript_29766/g.45375 Transcript_29766/m.45375 type:complete len:87 (+) Transcript_29766:3211-3471(+)